MPATEFGCLPTIVGSMPHTDPDKACAAITHYIKDIPAWPQLPKRAFVENMYAMYSQGFPGAVVEKDRIYITSTPSPRTTPPGCTASWRWTGCLPWRLRGS